MGELFSLFLFIDEGQESERGVGGAVGLGRREEMSKSCQAGKVSTSDQPEIGRRQGLMCMQ